MAIRVPTVTGPQVEERALQDGMQRTNVTPSMLSNPQLGDMGKVLADVGAQLQEREDADVLMRAETEIKGKYLEWEGEAKQRRGQNAWGVAKEAGEWWDKESGRVLETVSSPRAKALLQREVAKMRGISVGAFSGYEAGQRRESIAESAQASIVGSINMAAANPGNPELLAATKGDILKRTQMLAKVNGWAPEMAEAKQAEHLTNFHKQVLQGLVRDNPAAAEAYFNANKGEIEGSQHAEVGAFAAKATSARVGDATADAIWQAAGPKSDREPVALDVLLARAREELKDRPDARDAAINGLKERAAAFKDSRRERDDQLEASVNQAIMGGASARQIRSMPEFLRLSPEAARKLSDFMDNRALRAEQVASARESRADAAESRQQRALERRGMAAYLDMSDPNKLAGMSDAQVINLLPVLGNEHTKRLMDKKRELAKNPQALAEARIDTEDFQQVAQDMGLRPFAAKTEDEKAALGGLKFRVEQLISVAQQGGKKALSRTEKLDLMRQEMAKTVTVDGFWSNKEVPVIALTPDQVKDVAVPKEARVEIAGALAAMAREHPNDPRFKPTEDNLRRWYLRGKSPAANLIPNGR